tara:strand:+ start:4745 stop:6922 length:2178 start_codon:yes stop_codon:yes gene_type:complete
MRASKKIGKPSNKEGNEGEITLRRDTGGRTSIFGKINGIWNRVGLNVLGKPSLGSFAFFRGPNEIFHDSRFSIKKGVATFQSNLTSTGDIIAKGPVSEVAVVTTDAGADAGIQFSNEADESNWNIASDGSDEHKLKIDKHWVSGSDTKLTIDNDGNVGIGTSTPIADLDIRNGHIKVGESNIYASNVDQPYLIVADDDFYTGANTNWGTYGMQHRIKSTDGGVPRLTIDSLHGELFSVIHSGNVGIGTSGPSTKLDVDGTVKATGFTIGGHTIDDIDIGSEFTDADDHLMSAGAIKEKIEAYGYSTASGDITAVTITTDSGGGSAASDTGGSADFSILGSNGVGVTNSGTTITATAVPGEIDHDSLNNFVANEHIDWTGASAGTIHATNYTNTTYSEATSSAEGLMSIAHHDKLDGIEASATADQTQADINGLAITTTGALDSGSITSGFGSINNGSSGVTTGDISCQNIATNLPAITSGSSKSTVQVSQELNDGTGSGSFYTALELHVKETATDQWDEGRSYIFCHNASSASAGGDGVTPKFKVSTDGVVTAASTLSCSEITSGAVVWQRFQFYVIGGNTSRFYYLDHDDRYNSLAHWDNYSTILGAGSNLTMLDERMSAFPEVAENCIFAGGIGTIYNDTGTDNPKISIYYDESTLAGDEDQSEAFASLVDTDVTINTQDRKYGFTLDAVTGTTLNAGCKYVPTISNIATTVWGSMTLKFITK